MENYYFTFDAAEQIDELNDEAENFDWDEYYVDEPEAIAEDNDNDPGYLDIDWLYEELNTYEIDGDF